jgi:hypothetical protein
LGKAGRSAWHAIMSDYDIGDAGGLMIVEQIAGAHDRLADCHEAIAREGHGVQRVT